MNPYTEIFSHSLGGSANKSAETTNSIGQAALIGDPFNGGLVTGSWTNGKSIGIACNQSGGCATGEPINLGNGNVFDQITDYETAGQNPLSLIRYYNSMAWPATSATSMGANWRTNYDRYLHIINPSAIYGVEAERPDGAGYQFRVEFRHLHAGQRRRFEADRVRQHMDPDRPERHS